MKKALLKDSIKEIKNTYKRFLSILLMAFLGVGFFAGIRATSPDMISTIDNYYKQSNVYDIQVMSTLGLTDEDVEALKQVEGVESVSPTYTQDVEMNIGETEIVAKILCIQDDINKVKLLEGEMPKERNECLVEKNFLQSANKKIGDTIKIESTDGDSIIVENEMKIVGTAESPMYISRERGTSSLGSGKVNYYIYVPEENINSDIYTQIDIKVLNSAEMKTSTDEYEEYVESVKKNIEAIKEEREKQRYDSLINEATQKVEEAEQTFEQEKADGEAQIKSAEEKIENGRKEIEEGLNQISSNTKKADREFANAEKQIEDGKKELEEAEKELNSKKETANEEFANAEAQKNEQQENLNKIEQSLEQLQVKYNEIEEALKQENITQEQKEQLEQQKNLLDTQIKELNNNKAIILSVIEQIDEQVSNGKKGLEEAEKLIEQSKQEIEKNESTLEKNKKSTYAQIQDAKEEIEQAQKDLEEGKTELQKNKEEFENKIKEAEGELIDARAQISEIENPEWYILDRNSNTGYNGFIQDTESVENIGRVFPVVFFIIATLISLTSMTRMVEEQRQQIGTLKALGYNSFQIAEKYIIYASAACLIGGFLGMCVGFVLLPKVIWMMYSMLYTIPDFILEFNFYYGGVGLGIASLCIIGATIYAVRREVKNKPAELIRPKAPKLGKRVLLERITFIWKRLNFIQKVTVRNIFRYKKRFLMTIIGICGCTAMILAGFGLRDSIRSLLPNQYEKVFNYDMQLVLKNKLENDQIDEVTSKLQNNEKVTEVVQTFMTSATIEKVGNQDIQIVVPKDKEQLEKVINLNDVETKEKINLSDNEIVITDKLAELIQAKVGDTVKLKNSDEIEKEVKIQAIAENYIFHYVYMSEELYTNMYGDCSTNVLLVKNVDMNEEEEQKLAREVISENEISSITLTSSTMTSMDETMSSLNYVVWVLIISAGLLAFVVLYNLANVNISERIRELATIKVLGFYDNEVYSYVNRETIILGIIGIILGLGAGFFLNTFIIKTCETNMLRFAVNINFMSYIYSILITVVFMAIVNIATYFALKKIDMIESLKSVE